MIRLNTFEQGILEIIANFGEAMVKQFHFELIWNTLNQFHNKDNIFSGNCPGIELNSFHSFSKILAIITTPFRGSNENLKKIGQAAGVNSPTTKVNFSGKIKREVCLPKYNFLTTHIGRKTFVTLLKQHKFTDIEIQSISGHSSYKEMLPYIGVDRQAVKDGLEKMFG